MLTLVLCFAAPQMEVFAAGERNSGHFSRYKQTHYRPSGKVHYWHRYPKARATPHYYHKRRAVSILPVGVAMLTIAGIHYYYHHDRGIYFKRVPGGYLEVRAPVGAVVTRLPAGYISFNVGPSLYYYFGGIYYRNAASGYIVVDPPYEKHQPVNDSGKKTEDLYSGTVIVTTELLNVRTGPGMEHPVMYQLGKGAVLEIHGQANNPGWIYIKTPQGKYGWVMAQFTASSSG
jgi:hypothetical protein